jgi:3',5'-cyclic AMP phosphodiesterase CpdA
MDSNRPAPPYRGKISDEQLRWLSGLCSAPDERPLIVALHHPVLPMGSRAWDEVMNLIDGDAFHRALLPARDRIRGVFSGHVHQNTDIVRDGIPYFTGLSSWYQIENYPNQTELTRETFSDPGFSVVLVTRDQLYVRRHTFMVDPGSMTD